MPGTAGGRAVLLGALWLLVAIPTCGAVGTTGKMRAAVISSHSWDFKFHLEKVAVMDLDVPVPGHGEVLVRVQASNINPVDHKIVSMAGWLWSYPHKLGSDLAGVVVALGPGCERLKVGQAVWGEATTLGEAVVTGGTYAQYAAVSESVLGVRPARLSTLEAGAMPMVALTSYESLSWAAGGASFPRGRNATVLVLGGGGGTGHMGIQLAKAMGAREVITTCSSLHATFVKELGADRVIDYHAQNYYDVLAPKSVDVVYDCVGQSGTGDHAFGIIKDGGHFITLLRDGLPSLGSRLHRPDIHTYAPVCVGSCSQYDRIDRVAELVEGGKLRVHIDSTYGLEDIVQAYNHSLSGHATGKIAVQMPQSLPTAALSAVVV